MSAKELVASAGEAVAWYCTRRLDGDKRVFDEPCVATNPEYVKAHPRHDWKPLYTTPPDPMLQRVVEALEKLAMHVRPTCSDLYDEAIAAIAEARKVLDKGVGGG